MNYTTRNRNTGCGAVIIGIVLFIASFFVLWINENNYVNAQKMAKFMAKNVVSITNYSPDNDRKLVHYSAKINTNEIISDEFIKINTPALDRKVEMYQWDEKSHTDSNDNRTYSYKKVWSEFPINSSSFHQSGHDNPSMDYRTEKYRAQTANIGEFTVNAGVIKSLTPQTSVMLNENQIHFNGIHRLDGSYALYLPTGKNNSNNIGDYKISYKYIPVNTTVTVIAAQHSKTLREFVNSKFKIALSYPGTYSSSEIIKMYEDQKSQEAMTVRIIGIVMMFIGLQILISPITTLLSFIPVIGNIGNRALGVLAFILGLILSTSTIAIAWITVRPEISIPILIIAACVLWFTLTKKNNKSPISN